MPVTFDVDPSKRPSATLAQAFRSFDNKNAESYIRKACPQQMKTFGELLQASFGESVSLEGNRQVSDEVERMFPCGKGGFVSIAVTAYNQHYHLVIRPDDVWISILAQFNFYVNAHAEELRSIFVSHQGKKELVVRDVGSRYSVDFARMARRMGDLMRDNIKDPEFRDWVMADFSTTTSVDRTIYAVEFMSTLKEYFSYTMMLSCGLPRVTLEGTRADWETLFARVDKLETYGEESAHWVKMLKPVLRRFVQSFVVFSEEETPSNGGVRGELRTFWNNIANVKSGGSGPSWLSGWITAFCPWNAKGVWMDPTCAPGAKPNQTAGRYNARQALVLDDVTFPVIDSAKVPNGFVEVDVKLDDNGTIFDTAMIAGHLGGKIHTGSPTGGPEGVSLGEERLGILSGWFMYVKKPEEPEPDFWAEFAKIEDRYRKPDGTPLIDFELPRRNAAP